VWNPRPPLLTSSPTFDLPIMFESLYIYDDFDW
jgi:hypothetical protein